MKVLLNFADVAFRASQLLNSESGLAVGGFEKVLSFGPRDIDAEFANRNHKILREPRGAGLWLWKPYLVCRALEQLREGDFLFYCDSGSIFLGPIDRLIDVCERTGQDLICFELLHLEKHWTKRDTFVLLGCEEPQYAETQQRLASFSLWRKTERTVAFAHEWLAASQDERMLGDGPNVMGWPNYEGFQDHRHDQSIFSLLSKQWGLPAFRDPSQHGNKYVANYRESEYPQLIHHTRDRKMTLRQKVSRETQRFAHQCRRFLSR